jgi:hypothetical protein
VREKPTIEYARKLLAKHVKEYAVGLAMQMRLEVAVLAALMAQVDEPSIAGPNAVSMQSFADEAREDERLLIASYLRSRFAPALAEEIRQQKHLL